MTKYFNHTLLFCGIGFEAYGQTLKKSKKAYKKAKYLLEQFC